MILTTAATAVVDPPQPVGKGEYPLSALIPSTIKVYANQAAYAATDKPVPAYNNAMPIKGWVDTSVKPGTFEMITYNTAHLDTDGQKPVVTTISVPSYLAGTINLPPDNGPQPTNNAGVFPTPIRALLPNEKLIASPFGISVVNTDIYDPAPTPSPTGDGFTAADRATLNAIAAAMGLSKGS